MAINVTASIVRDLETLKAIETHDRLDARISKRYQEYWEHEPEAYQAFFMYFSSTEQENGVVVAGLEKYQGKAWKTYLTTNTIRYKDAPHMKDQEIYHEDYEHMLSWLISNHYTIEGFNVTY